MPLGMSILEEIMRLIVEYESRGAQEAADAVRRLKNEGEEAGEAFATGSIPCYGPGRPPGAIAIS
jgi:hypothetical protein